MRWWNSNLTIVVCLSSCLASTALADIRTTPHSLVSKTLNAKEDSSAICVFCHTPNQSGSPPNNPPLWQHSIGTLSPYVIYDDIGRLGLGKTSVGSQSMACLSCHDGNQALGISKFDHPFGVPYRGVYKSLGSESTSSAGKSTADDDPENPSIRAKSMVSSDEFRDVSQGTVEDRSVWWVSTSGNGGRRMRNDLPLYGRHDKQSGKDLPFIECSSCHDPHVTSDSFLRLPSTGSKLCLTCHVK